MRTGHRDFPQSSFVPLHSAHSDVDEEGVDCMFLKAAICATIVYQR
jgi:hypothetical protein